MNSFAAIMSSGKINCRKGITKTQLCMFKLNINKFIIVIIIIYNITL